MARKIFPTAVDCELAFYDAFERGDLKLMMAIWSDEPDTICVHPQGPRLAGLSAIRDSFAEIFSHAPTASKPRIKVSELRKHQSQTLAIHSVYESFVADQPPASGGGEVVTPAPILATNIYLLTPNGWRMIVHHASLSPQGTVAEEQGVSRILH
ncbi:MAG: nuclear transport factor 2 family protein [Rhodocyclaceae bacterium]|nr:nuclear transport factor 2 family protein [Rhodocyclaceae bacterium]MCA3083623.1 nuclear transport factor 2 family protein [Rhodocyclaceae bacterium]